MSISTAAGSLWTVLAKLLAVAALLVVAGSGPACAAGPAGVAPDGGEEGDAPEVDEQQIEDLVADAQRLLRASGYDPGPIDGVVGPRTQRAIRAYQAAARRYGTLEAIKGPPPDGPTPAAAGIAPPPPKPALGR